MDATTVAADLAKDVFEVALANRANRIIDRKRLTRRQFELLVESLRAAIEVVMEACGTATYWGMYRLIQALAPTTTRCEGTGVAFDGTFTMSS